MSAKTVRIDGADLSLPAWLRLIAADLDQPEVTSAELRVAARRADVVETMVGLTPEAVVAFYQGAAAQATVSRQDGPSDDLHLCVAVLAQRALRALDGAA